MLFSIFCLTFSRLQHKIRPLDLSSSSEYETAVSDQVQSVQLHSLKHNLYRNSWQTVCGLPLPDEDYSNWMAFKLEL